MKIAFATTDNKTVNEHFGCSRSFAVYNVLPGNFTFIAARDINPETAKEEATYESDKIDKRIEAVKDCAIVYCRQIGPAAAARLIQKRIYPMKVDKDEEIEVLLQRLSEVLKKPPVWLKKIMEVER